MTNMSHFLHYKAKILLSVMDSSINSICYLFGVVMKPRKLLDTSRTE